MLTRRLRMSSFEGADRARMHVEGTGTGHYDY
jgi:hypothetical protein